jgi:hypothetical protein
VRIPAVNRFTLFGLVVLALVALFAVAALSKPVTLPAGQQSQPHSPSVAAVSVGARACPEPGAQGSHDTGVAVIAAAHPGSGHATVSRLSPADTTPAAPLASVSQPGTLSVSNVTAVPSPAPSGATTPSDATTGTGKSGTSKSTAAAGDSTPAAEPGGVMVQATGSMAQGLEAEQTGTGGTVTAGCASPATDFWFAVPGQQFTSVIQLYLMNTDSQAATVDVDVVTDTGPLQTGVDTGINVPAHGMVMQSLATLVRGSRAIGLHVHASAGQVVAAVSESSHAGQSGQWLPAAQAPADRLVIPAMPGSPGTRQLYVSDPGTADAAVRLSVVAAGGSYEPTGAGAIDIPAGSASMIELPSLTGITGAAVLTSNTPVTASVVVPGGEPDGPGAMAVAALPLQEQGVVADVGERGDDTSLVLSAPGAAAKVRMVTGSSGLTPGGSGAGSQLITIPKDRTITVKVPSPAAGNQAFAILLTPLPGSGPVYVGRVLADTSGTVLSVLPVASALTSVPLPSARGSLTATTP